MIKIAEKEIRFIDLFGGVGGFRLGLERANKRFKCVWYNDNNKYAVRTYNERFGEDYKARDIREIAECEIPKHDILCAGFPCQSFSIAGKRGGFTDDRGTLFKEICRVARYHKPKILLLENVKGLLSAPLVDKGGEKLAWTKGFCFFHILNKLGKMGYDVEWQVLDSRYFVPQNRERVFIIGHLRGGCTKKIFPIQEDGGMDNKALKKDRQTVPCLEATGYKGVSSERFYGIGINMIHNADREISRVYSIDGISPTLHLKTGGWQEPKIAIPVLTPNRKTKRQHGRRFKRQGEPSFTLTGQDIHGVAIIEKNGEEMMIRRLTPKEYERLQGFPDGWALVSWKNRMMSDTQRYRMMGNAVTVNVIEAIGRRMLEVLL